MLGMEPYVTFQKTNWWKASTIGSPRRITREFLDEPRAILDAKDLHVSKRPKKIAAKA